MHVGMEKGSSLSPPSPDNMVFASAADLKGDTLDSKPQNPEPVSSHHSMAEASNVCKVPRAGALGGGGGGVVHWKLKNVKTLDDDESLLAFPMHTTSGDLDCLKRSQ